jgi:NhaP-type Na+/H+ and K+/H+ antiporter
MPIGLLIAAFLMFIARPAGVFIGLAFSKTSIRSKLFISWVGLRGAVPIVFATYPMIAGLDKAGMIFNLVFFHFYHFCFITRNYIANNGQMVAGNRTTTHCPRQRNC